MHGKVVIVVLALAVGMSALGTNLATAATSGSRIAPGGPDLKTALEKGLKARRPQEFAFIKEVVEKVDDGTLPLPLVKSTFLWARKQRPYPTVYFEHGLKTRAKKLGIAL